MVRPAIHGGAGGDGPWKGPTDLDPQRVACMHNVLSTVGSMLESGMDAIEAVTLAVEMMEDEPFLLAPRHNYRLLLDRKSCQKDQYF